MSRNIILFVQENATMNSRGDLQELIGMLLNIEFLLGVENNGWNEVYKRELWMDNRSRNV